MDGILVINKPAGYTSHDCIAILRGVTGIKKLGHTGTLDPNATGVLPVCAGKATRLIEYMDTASKIYEAGVKFGMVSRTQDIWGEALSPADAESSGLQLDPGLIPEDAETIREALKSFEGEIQQVPPAYSAVLINGRRAYDIARSGGSPDLAPRTVTIHRIELSSFDPEDRSALITVECSRGTYVRTICHDLGQKLGCGAVLSSLVRTEACGFSISQALDLEQARKMSREELLTRFLPIETALSGMPRLELDAENAKRYLNGMTLKADPAGHPQESPVAVFSEGILLGISAFTGDSLKHLKVFS